MKTGDALIAMALVACLIIISGLAIAELEDEVETYQSALIEAHKNYQAALDGNVELKYCREFMWSTMLMANGEVE